MRAQTIQIIWHEKQPIYSVDFQHGQGRMATGGADKAVRIWRLKKNKGSFPEVEYLAALCMHMKSVNCVRFSPNGQLLASAGDDGFIFVWRLDPEGFIQPGSDDVEVWSRVCVLKGHVDDVYDLSWGPSSDTLMSGSVDNSCALWNVPKVKMIKQWKKHSHYCQGVAFDPRGIYVASQSADRSVRIMYTGSIPRTSGGQPAKVKKSKYPAFQMAHNLQRLPVEDTDGKEKGSRLFVDETLATFFRRLAWTPEGSMLITPAGQCRTTNANDEEIILNTTYAFARRDLGRPAIHYPGSQSPSVAIRCCPVLFKLKGDSSSPKSTSLPYRIVFAVATHDACILYDTESVNAIAIIRDFHYAQLTDIAWSPDAKYLVISSQDGYCTVVYFSKGELGVPLSKEEYPLALIEEEDQPEKEAVPAATPATTATITPSEPIIITPEPSQERKRIAPTPVTAEDMKKRRIAPVLVTKESKE